ncbi:kinase-like domain-containing protein [Gigaspora rosea]|uniref:Kinase-like domain-containing protein n=1 Tax=Gigaspora rosea TaxID=44941 RepID=A0A397TQF9_9GLOM|nr:kinase-like domain-containing protein [Gigaspora rosea]
MTTTWCLSCDPDKTTRWTSGNKNIDDYVKLIGKGGFGSVYSALWLDGIRKVDGDDFNYISAREPFCIVALKTLANSKETNLMECKLNYSKLAIYGITQNTKAKEFFDISKELDYVHYYAGYIHADFHSENILQDKQSYIADLGLSRKNNESVLEGAIYGVMPYVAPEVLSAEQQFTQVADIYGPFDGQKFDIELAVKICEGSRPEFALGTPKCYIELVEKCMDSDPKERPNAYYIRKTIDRWLNKIDSSDDNEIKRQFLDADKVIKSLPIPKHPDEMYTSKSY